MKKIMIITSLVLLYSCGGSKTENANAIKGLEPTDVYMNMENNGFTTKTNFTDVGKSWTCSKEDFGLDLTVETYSSDIHSVESVRATAMIVTDKTPEATLSFLQFVSTLPYEGAKPEQASEWVAENLNNDKATVTIGAGKITISAPSDRVRILNIVKK